MKKGVPWFGEHLSCKAVLDLPSCSKCHSPLEAHACFKNYSMHVLSLEAGLSLAFPYLEHAFLIFS